MWQQVQKSKVHRPIYKQKRVMFSGLAVGAGLVLLFQNCGQPAVTGTENELLAQAAEIPFSYDATLDQISYMSCNAMSGAIDNSTYYTIRAGAYRNSGLRLVDEFATKRPKVPRDRLVDLLSASPRNTGTKLQLAVRPNTNYQGILTNPDSQTGAELRDYTNMFADLGTLDMSANLIDMWQEGYKAGQDKRMKHIRDGTTAGKRIEGQVAFTNGYVLGNSVRDFLSNQGFLAMTFTNQSAGATKTLARSEADFDESGLLDEKREVYGRGYRLRFGQPRHYNGGAMNGNFPAIALETVEEFKLNDANDTARPQWACPAQLQFRIVRIQDIAGTNAVAADCPLLYDAQNTDQANLKIARQSLRVEDWYINMAKRCIVPKRERVSDSNCYGNNVATQPPIYNLTNACSFATANQLCVHYASICHRQ